MTRTEEVTIPIEQRGVAREALLLIKDAHADALAHDLDEFLDGSESLDTLHTRRGELMRVEGLIEELENSDRHGDDAELSGPSGLIRDILWAALVSATDELSEACADYERGKAELDRIEESKRSADTWVELFLDFERRDRRIDPPDVAPE